TRTPLRDLRTRLHSLRTRLHRLRTRLRSLRSRAFDLVTHDVGAGVGGSRTVTARIYLGQLDRLSPLRRPDGTRTDPGQHEPRLTFEEPMRPHPTGRTALGRVLGQRGDLHGLPGRRHHHRLTVFGIVGAHRPEEHHFGVL